jgi:signal transduction histidine kinase
MQETDHPRSGRVVPSSPGQSDRLTVPGGGPDGSGAGPTSRIPGLPFYPVAALIVLVESARFLVVTDGTRLAIAELGFVCSIAAVYAVLGRRAGTRVAPRRAVRIATVSVLFGAVGTLLSSVAVLRGILAGDPSLEGFFPLVFGGSATAVVGLGVGYYYYGFRAQYEELQREVERTRRLSRELSVTYRVLRHNLRNELTIIEGHIEMARGATGSAPAEVSSHLEVVGEHLQAVDDICEKATELSKLTPQSSRRSLDASVHLAAAAERVQERYPAADIEVSAPEAAPVLAHPRLPRALEELLENAVEHNDLDRLAVTARIDPATGPDDATRIEIADTGSGVPAVEVENLRQPAEGPVSHGQGLGLWVVHTVVEQSEGRLRFRENAPSGTVVAIELEPSVGEPTDRLRADAP